MQVRCTSQETVIFLFFFFFFFFKRNITIPRYDSVHASFEHQKKYLADDGKLRRAKSNVVSTGRHCSSVENDSTSLKSKSGCARDETRVERSREARPSRRREIQKANAREQDEQ